MGGPTAAPDAAIERAAQELRQVLAALAASLDPFPGFQGMQTIYAVEVEMETAPGQGRGCVVVGPDGALYELLLHTIPGPLGEGDADQVDELRELDLTPQEYVQYAYQAVKQLAELHRQRSAS